MKQLVTKKDLIAGLKRPYRIPRYVWYKHVQKRVPFTEEEVAGGEIPMLHARIYIEAKLLGEVIGDFHAQRSLEIGCGYGRLTPWIAEHSVEHCSIEPESSLRNEAEKLYPNFQFYQASAQKLPFSDDFFDLCVCWTVLVHIPPTELEKVITEIKRVCSQKSVIILSESTDEYEADYEPRWGFWRHKTETLTNLLSPWKMVCRKEGYKGLSVMRFERS